MGRRPKSIDGERPRLSRKLTPEQAEYGRQLMLAAIGCAGWALAAELLMVLTQRDVLTDKAARKVMHGALECLDAMYEIAPDPAIDAARETLAGQIEGWRKGGKVR